MQVLGQGQDAQGIADAAAVLAQTGGQILVSQTMLFEQGLVSLRQIERVEVLALDVLDQAQLGEVLG